MSLKKLFGQGVKNYESASVNVESSTFVDKKVKEQETYLPPIDFATASNFVKYGLAELYYDSSISRIYDNYPYDGSKAEIVDFHQSSSYLDRWMYDQKYPKSTGYVNLGTTGYQGGMTDGYGNTTTNEFIRVWGGIHTASAGMSTKPLRETFDKSGKYELSLNRTQNWRCDPVSGTTIEFWLKIPAFDASLTERQVLLHLDNGVTPGTTGGGSLLLQINRTAPNDGTFLLSMKDGTTIPSGPILQKVSGKIADVFFDTWHHYALTIANGSTGLDTTFYIDGVETTKMLNIGSSGLLAELPGLINGYIGALQTLTPSKKGGLGKGKLSGSLDEFRYWKKARTGQQIGLNWFRQVGGGANSDDSTANKDLGVYLRFNEGITGIVATDQIALDYSGRLANGHWQGYTTSTQRNTGSAMASSSFAYVEDENPIIYSTNSRVVSLKAEMQTSGSIHDNEIGGSIFHSLPSWLTDQDLEDGAGNLRNLTQIIASYFDTLHAQITALPNLKDKGYVQKDNKPLPFASKLLTDKGFIVRDIFVDAEIVNTFSGVDFDSIKFEEQLDRTKNLIYTNIYNNLEAIYKSKGTEKSIRNFIRCFGIDDEIIKLNVYTDGGTHYFSDKAKGSSVKKKYMNFDDPAYFSSTIFQTSSSLNNLTFISGSKGSKEAANNAFTVEADIVVPYKKESSDKGYYPTPFLSSSLFGFHEANDQEAGDYDWVTAPVASVGAYLVRDSLNSKNAKFIIKSEDGTINLTSSYIPNIYDNNHWNMAFRIKPDIYPYGGKMARNNTPLGMAVSSSYKLEFYAVNYNMDQLENEVLLTASIDYDSGSAFLCRAKRIYAGANRTNFRGLVAEQSDIQLGGVSAWLDYLENSVIQQHNKDPLNFGNSQAFRGSNIFTVENKQVPSQELTIFNWQFDLVTGSTTAGDFTIQDTTSGSVNTIYSPWLDELIRREYQGRGYGYGSSKTSFVENEYLYAQRKELPEISYTNNNVFIKTEKDINFIVDDDVSDNFYALEKSLNQIVSEEMLTVFASIQEFANLMGRPVDRYRMNYKRLEKVRQDFFNRVEGDPDQERFMNFYKWIDGSISQMVNQLIPAGVNFGSGVTDVIESHILERNKYQRRIGLLDQLESTEGSMRGIEELTYNWKFGHAPQGELFATGVIGAGAGFNTPQIGDTVVVVSTDGTSKTYTGAAAEDTSAREFLCGSGSDAAAASLANCINAVDGHGGKIKATPGAYDGIARNLLLEQLEAGAAGNTVITPSNSLRLPSINFSGANDNVNCLWQKERRSRLGIDAAYPPGSAQETIREISINQTNATSSAFSTVDKTIYQGSTFAARRLSRPYKIGIEFGNNIHAGINYNLQKDREFYKRATQWFSAKDSVGVMKNIYTVGIGTGQSIIEQQKCDDVYNPSRKKFKHFECVVGRNASGIYGNTPKDPSLEYIYKMHSSMYWPFNVVSGTVNSGYNAMVVESYNSSSIITNLHSDTIDLTNEISIQGPFTQAHIGGNQFRHQPLNKYDATLTNPGGGATLNNLRNVYTRAEGYRYLFGENPLSDPTSPSDGAMGLTGPDYGVTPGGKAGDITKRFAVWFREERAKRPVNIKNIQSTTGSSVLGNYEHKYEVVSTFGATQQRFQMRKELSGSGDGLFGTTYSTLPQTTQPNTPMNQGTFPVERASLEFDVVVQLFSGVNNGDTFTIIQSPNTNHTFTFDTSVLPANSTATIIGIDPSPSTATKATEAVYTALAAAIAAGVLYAKLAPNPGTGPFTLSFTRLGTIQVNSSNPTGTRRMFDPINVDPYYPTGRLGSGGRITSIPSLPSQLSGATPQKTIIRTRFSAPGGPETMSEGFLNISSLEYSAYNSINFRNLSVQGSGSGEIGTIRVNSNLNKREGSRTLLARHLGKGGTDSQWGSISWEDSGSLTPMAAFYKQNQNTLITPRIKSTSLRKAINSPETTTVNSAYLFNKSMASPWLTSGPLSFSFWINVTSTSLGTSQTIIGHGSVYLQIKSNTIEFFVKDEDLNNSEWSTTYTSTNKWDFIVVSWNGMPTTNPIIYINGISQTVTKITSAATNPVRNLQTKVYLFDGVAGGSDYELQGSLTDMAVWTTEFTPTQVSELYNADGKALGVSFYSSLIDYWRLGTENVLSAIAVGDAIPNGTVIPSDIGKNALTAEDNIKISNGPYTINTSEDVNQYDNMNYNSLLPRSDFQYSWIRQTLSGSNGACSLSEYTDPASCYANGGTWTTDSSWMKNQKVRGYAPKSGEMILVGNGALTKLETAINWPLISNISCCVVIYPIITVTIPSQVDGTIPSFVKVGDFSLEVISSDAAKSQQQIYKSFIDNIVFTITVQPCCVGKSGNKSALTYYGDYTNGGSKPQYDPVYQDSPPSFPTGINNAEDDRVVYIKLWAIDCDGVETTLIITLSNAEIIIV